MAIAGALPGPNPGKTGRLHGQADQGGRELPSVPDEVVAAFNTISPARSSLSKLLQGNGRVGSFRPALECVKRFHQLAQSCLFGQLDYPLIIRNQRSGCVLREREVETVVGRMAEAQRKL